MLSISDIQLRREFILPDDQKEIEKMITSNLDYHYKNFETK